MEVIDTQKFVDSDELSKVVPTQKETGDVKDEDPAKVAMRASVLKAKLKLSLMKSKKKDSDEKMLGKRSKPRRAMHPVHAEIKDSFL